VLLYDLRQSSISSECAAVHSGMTFAQVEDLIHSKAWPTEESVTGNQFSFGRWDICQVEFDPSNEKVTRAQMLQGPVSDLATGRSSKGGL
jgi:hypothetical protein